MNRLLSRSTSSRLFQFRGSLLTLEPQQKPVARSGVRYGVPSVSTYPSPHLHTSPLPSPTPITHSPSLNPTACAHAPPRILSCAMAVPTVIAFLASIVWAPLASSFSSSGSGGPSLHLHRSCPPKATIEDLWPTRLTPSEKFDADGATLDDDEDDERRLLASTLDSVVKIYATHSEPDFLIPWQKQHQTTSTSSGFVLGMYQITFESVRCLIHVC